MDRLLLIHESALKPFESKFKVNGIDMCAKNLLKHDTELLDKVAEKLKAKYPLYFNEFGMSVNDTLQKDIDEVIAEMKAEVKQI